MVKRITTTLLVLLSSTGCSLLIDNSSFLGSDAGVQPDAGGGDGGRDAGRDAGPNAPTRPEVHIEPSEPRTLDDLSVVIDVESTDPLAAGAITYEHRWLRDAEDTGETGTTVASARTAKGQTWTVEVTPVTADDRRGPPATASVTILNTPPTIRTVGLSSYRPVVDDTLTALPGSASDVDGDTVTVRYRWLVDGAAASPTTRQLALTDATTPAGSEIFVEARAFDGTDESEPVAAGPAVVVANETRWIQHWPDRSNIELVTYDQRHERLLLGVSDRDAAGPQLWEHDLVADRFIRLRPTGIPPRLDFLHPGAQDPVRGRIYFLSGSPLLELYELDVANRGHEVWRTVPISGATPPTRVSGMVFDSTRSRILFLTPNEDDTAAELWELDLSGTEAIATLIADGQPAGVVGGTLVEVPNTATAYVVGGIDGSVAGNLIYRLDYAAADLGLQELTRRLPEAAMGLAAAAHPDGTRIVFGFGLSTLGVGVDGPWMLDLDTEEIVRGESTDARISGRIGTIMLADQPRNRLLVVPGRADIFSQTEYQVFSIPGSIDSVEPIHTFGDTAPAPLSGSIFLALETGDVGFFGGADRDRVMNTRAWRTNVFSATFRTWTPLDVMADPSRGLPEPRAGLNVDSGGFTVGFFGGRVDGGGLADGSTWRLVGTRWVARTLASTAVLPEPRDGATFFSRSGCWDLGVFGGTTTGGSYSTTVDIMQCASGDAECTWSTLPTTGTPPSPRFDTAVLYGGGGRAFVGGRTAAGAVMDAFALDDDCVMGTWTELNLSGDVPSARSGHSISNGLLFGGATASSHSNEAYDVILSGDTMQFTRIAVAADGDGLPEPRRRHLAFRDGNRLFVYGGTRGPLAFSGHDRVFGDMWELRIVR